MRKDVQDSVKGFMQQQTEVCMQEVQKVVYAQHNKWVKKAVSHRHRLDTQEEQVQRLERNQISMAKDIQCLNERSTVAQQTQQTQQTQLVYPYQTIVSQPTQPSQPAYQYYVQL